MLKKTKNRRKALKPQSVNKRQSVKELTEQFEIDHFLIDEQIYYSEQLNKQLQKKPAKTGVILNDLDKMVDVDSSQKLTQELDEFLPKQEIKVSFDQKGKKTGLGRGSPASSAYTLNLKKRPLSNWREEKRKLSYLYDEFKVSQPTFTLPAPSLLKKKVLKERMAGLKIWLGELLRSLRPAGKFKVLRTKVRVSDYSPRLSRLKTALNFALVALLLIVPIRGYVLYNQLTATEGKVLGVTEEAIWGFQEGIESAGRADWLKASLNFNQSADYFAQAQAMVDNYQSLINFLESIPLAGQKIEDGKNLLQAGQLFSQAAINFSQIVSQLSQSTAADQTPSQSLVAIRQGLNQSLSDLKQAFVHLEDVSANSIPLEYRQSFIELQNNLPLFLNSLAEVNKLLDLTLSTLGYDTPKRYLIINQNNNELRATGGFMGSYALVDFKGGKIVNLEVPGGGFYDLKADFFEKVIAPEPMHLLGTPWMPWDANWWPDFPTAMKKLLWFYGQAGGPSVDGIIALNAAVLPELLQVSGSIELPEYRQVFTPENVVLALQHKTEFEYDPQENRPKKIIADLTTVLIERLMSVSNEQLSPLLFTLKDSLENKDIQFYFTDENLQSQAREFGWTGELKNSTKDYLQVTRTNIGGGKTDQFITQEIKHYSYLQADGSIVNTVAVTLTHQGHLIEPQEAAYVFAKVLNKSYLRLYLPQGSRLLEVSGYDAVDPDWFKEIYAGFVIDKDLERISGQVKIDPETNTRINNELGKTVFGHWLLLEPGQAKTLTFSYQLPFKLNLEASTIDKILTSLGFKESTVDNSYSLLIQNQSGAKNTTFESRLYLPDYMSIIWSDASAGQLVASGQSANFKTDLNKDYLYSVLLDVDRR